MDRADGALLSALGRPENQDAALEELASSAAIATVEAAVPSLVSIASRQPSRSARVADVLRRLDHDVACQLLTAALAYVVCEQPSLSGAAALVEMVQLSFPPALPLLRDLLLHSSDPEINRIGRSMPASSQHPFVERRALGSRNRWSEVTVLGRSAGSREDLVRLFEAMSETWAYLSENEEPSEWRHRALDDYFRHLPAREFLALPRMSIVGKDLGDILADLAHWFSTEPCLPLDPSFWRRAGQAYFDGTLSTAKPDRLIVVPFVVDGAVCEFFLGRD